MSLPIDKLKIIIEYYGLIKYKCNKGLVVANQIARSKGT